MPEELPVLNAACLEVLATLQDFDHLPIGWLRLSLTLLGPVEGPAAVRFLETKLDFYMRVWPGADAASAAIFKAHDLRRR